MLSTTAARDPSAHEPAAHDGVCKNCETLLPAEWHFCAQCGQKAATPRLSLHEIGHETLHALLHVDRSALSLIKSLAVRPGRVALDYVSGRRKRYYGPFAFLVICVALSATAIAVTGFAVVTTDGPNAIADFLQHHVNLVWFTQVPIIAAALRLLTPRGPFNYAEFLVLAAYTMGMHILFYTVVDVGGWYVLKPNPEHAKAAYLALWPIWPLYLGFACAQFLPGAKALSAGKGILSALLAYAATNGAVFAVANLPQLWHPH